MLDVLKQTKTALGIVLFEISKLSKCYKLV